MTNFGKMEPRPAPEPRQFGGSIGEMKPLYRHGEFSQPAEKDGESGQDYYDLVASITEFMLHVKKLKDDISIEEPNDEPFTFKARLCLGNNLVVNGMLAEHVGKEHIRGMMKAEIIVNLYSILEPLIDKRFRQQFRNIIRKKA